MARQKRKIENRKVINSCQFIKIPWCNIKDIRIDETLLNTGNQPTNITVNRYANMPGTFHHIYPKSRLRRPLMQIEKTYIYFQRNSRNLANSREVSKLNELRNILIVSGNASSYYWNPGTGFGGFAPQYRRDDPHDNIEPKKPRNMDQRIYSLAVNIRPNSLSNLYSKIEDGKLEEKDIEACKNNELALRDATFYNTDNIGNTNNREWKVIVGRESDFNKPERIHELK